MNRLIATTLLGLTIAAPLAAAQDAALIAAYRAGVAGAKCNLGLDSEKSSLLGDAVQRAEQRSGLAQSDLDALWSKTEAEADADNATFCADAAALVDKAIAAR
jgi:hypothetical protein